MIAVKRSRVLERKEVLSREDVPKEPEAGEFLSSGKRCERS
jgi:hypothetical protein